MDQDHLLLFKNQFHDSEAINFALSQYIFFCMISVICNQENLEEIKEFEEVNSVAEQ